jgi:hypothetical protein
MARSDLWKIPSTEVVRAGPEILRAPTWAVSRIAHGPLSNPIARQHPTPEGRSQRSLLQPASPPFLVYASRESISGEKPM